MDYDYGVVEGKPLYWIVLGFSYEGMEIGHPYTLGNEKGVVTHNNFQVSNHLVGYDITIDLPRIRLPIRLNSVDDVSGVIELNCAKVTLVYVPLTDVSTL